MEESWRRKWKVVRKWNVIVWKGILFLFSVSWHHLTLLHTHWASVTLKSCSVWFVFFYVLTAYVFLTRDTVRHPRRFVFGKFVLKPNCSWSEAFVNRGLTVHFSGNERAKEIRVIKYQKFAPNKVSAFHIPISHHLFYNLNQAVVCGEGPCLPFSLTAKLSTKSNDIDTSTSTCSCERYRY